MKRKYILSVLVSIVVLLIGCSEVNIDDNSESNDTIKDTAQENQYKIVFKDVTFINYYYAQEESGVELTQNMICTSYEERNQEALYAFCVYAEGDISVKAQKENESEIDYAVRIQQARGKAVAEKALELGLMVLPEYVYCSYNNNELAIHYGGYNEEGWYPLCGQCVVVGTLEQIDMLFESTEPFDGYVWKLFAAPRPDWLDIMKRLEFSDDEMKWTYAGFRNRQEDIQKIIGTEPQVTLKVQVIVAE